MTRLGSNRDLYLAVAKLTKNKVESHLSLEDYLLNLRACGLQIKSYESIQIEEFFTLLQDSFEYQPPQFDAAWTDSYVGFTEESGFEGWLTTITSQIVDLHEMASVGDLENELRYFGIESPRGSHWVNFDPCTFLECAIAGSIGGWKHGDDSGRSYVPGPVTVLNENDELVTMKPEDVPRPIYSLPTISWTLFRDFLCSGQHYE